MNSLTTITNQIIAQIESCVCFETAFNDSELGRKVTKLYVQDDCISIEAIWCGARNIDATLAKAILDNLDYSTCQFNTDMPILHLCDIPVSLLPSRKSLEFYKNDGL